MQFFTLKCDYDLGAPQPVFADRALAEAAALAFFVDEWQEGWGDAPETYEDARARYRGQYLCEVVANVVDVPADLASGFEIRLIDAYAHEGLGRKPSFKPTHLALYKLGADGLAEWVADYELTTRGAEQLSAQVYALTIGALQGLGLGDTIAGAKP